MTNDSPYAVRLVEQRVPDTTETAWFAEHPALGGCNAVAKERADALAGLDRSRRAWLAVARDNGLEIPLPEETQQIVVIYLPKKRSAKARAAPQPQPEVVDVRIAEAEYA